LINYKKPIRRTKDYPVKPVACPFCTEKIVIDYKDTTILSRCITNRGKIGSRRKTRACAKHQRQLALAIKRARFLALLPYAQSHIWESGGVGIHQQRF
jgi:ribosomal protein S18